MKKQMDKKLKGMFMNLTSKVLNNKSEKNIDYFLKTADGLTKNYALNVQIKAIHEMYKEKPELRKFIAETLQTTDKKSLEKFLTNFVGNHNWSGQVERVAINDKHDTHLPYVALISPTMRCNLRCEGCYAADYKKSDDISIEKVDSLFEEMKSLGIYWVIILGGEPFFKDEMMKLYEKHHDMYFTPFTNGSLFDENLADELKRLGNIMPMSSLEGYEAETDGRRGKGVYDKVKQGMSLLKERGLLFGVSSAVTNKNIETVTSEEFIDMLIESGSKMSWYFSFMPVGENPMADTDLMLSPDERIMLGERVTKIRSTKPYFAIDFFNDAPYVDGCIAGREYLHINSKLDVEPCIFSHFAVDNLKDKTLFEAINSGFFKELRSRQPHNDNLLMPCMMIDNTNVIREVVKKHDAYPTHESARKMVEDVQFMRKLDEISKDFKPVADNAYTNFKMKHQKVSEKIN
ncbi:radical SAM protein [Acidaminobacter sp. JC074]|uniref:radical SAM protein n=1 Tax=Acidaminobacter sp. JC074 TaxID=2530199 RepID=UPI001F0F2089|nr:radical SAM protein [Acidaminobacter sp. JC074]MCH4887782.1 radical SAM protein [Acidaminobacter sp. JC074]